MDKRENQRMSMRIDLEALRERAVVWRLDCCKHSYKVGDAC